MDDATTAALPSDEQVVWQSAPAPLPLPDHELIALLFITLGVASALAYMIICRGNGSPGAVRAVEPDEYFQKVVGTMNAMGADSWSGTEQGCRWMQSDEEVEVTAPMPGGARGRDVVCKVLPASLSLSILGAPVVQGKLFRKVQHEECDWSIEDSGGERIFKLTLLKLVPTKGSQHWTSLLLPTDS